MTMNLSTHDEIIPDIFGGARGINAQSDIVTQTSDGRDLNDLWDEFQQVLNVYNAGRNTLVDFLTFPVTTLVEDIPNVGTDDFEAASEFGVAQSMRPQVNFSTMSYGFKWFDKAARFTWLYLADAPSNRVQATFAMGLEADNRLIFKGVMATLFYNAQRTTSLNGQGATVYPFYNGDGTVPPTYKNRSFDGAHSHYLVSGANAVDPGDLEALIDTIAEHGFGPQEGSTIVILANKQEVDVIRRFTRGVVTNGVSALYDFIPASGQPTQILPSQGLLGSLPPSSIRGMSVVGSYGNALIIEEGYIPAGYLAAFATGGSAQLSNPVGIREHANPAYRGLRLINGEQAGYPIVNSYFQRGFGTGVRQRGGAAIMQIKASGSYQVPSAYPHPENL